MRLQVLLRLEQREYEELHIWERRDSIIPLCPPEISPDPSAFSVPPSF